jgi:DNA-binding MarR family transcriptional regulator
MKDKRARAMGSAGGNKQRLIEEIIKRLVRRYSTAVILFHHAVAERLNVGPTDLQCLDLLREREAMNGSELAAVTGLTTGAITGMVARLEQAGYLRREPDPHDGRKQILSPALERTQEIRPILSLTCQGVRLY